MPIKKDGTGERRVEMEFVAPGTPEQIWDAMATGPGNSAWFTPATIEPRVGGRMQFDFGTHGQQAGEVTAWDPPRRFAYLERDWSPGAPPVATEIIITARSGDTCVVRMVHAFFTATDDWDDQMEGFEKGWPAFFEVLCLYLTHFTGQPAASFVAAGPVPGDHLSAWSRLLVELGLDAAHVGQRRTLPPALDGWSGIVERIDQRPEQRYILLRVDQPAPALAILGTYGKDGEVAASATVYQYGANATTRAEAGAGKWRRWLADHL